MCHYATVFFIFGTLLSSSQVYWKMWLRFDFAYHMASISLHRAWCYRKFSIDSCYEKSCQIFPVLIWKIVGFVIFIYNTNFVSITGKIYWPYQMFADLIMINCGAYRICWKMKFFDNLWTLHVGLSFGVIILSVEYYNKNVVKYVEIIDPMKESL